VEVDVALSDDTALLGDTAVFVLAEVADLAAFEGARVGSAFDAESKYIVVAVAMDPATSRAALACTTRAFTERTEAAAPAVVATVPATPPATMTPRATSARRTRSASAGFGS